MFKWLSNLFEKLFGGKKKSTTTAPSAGVKPPIDLRNDSDLANSTPVKTKIDLSNDSDLFNKK